MEGWRCGALKTAIVAPLQAAALKHHLVVDDFDGGEAARAVALRGLEAFRTLGQTGQLSVWPRRQGSDISSTRTKFHSGSEIRDAKNFTLKNLICSMQNLTKMNKLEVCSFCF